MLIIVYIDHELFFVIYHVKKQKILRFLVFKCDDLLLSSVIYNKKFNILWIETVIWIKQTIWEISIGIFTTSWHQTDNKFTAFTL